VKRSFCRGPFARAALVVLTAAVAWSASPASAHEGDTLTSLPPPGSPSSLLPAPNVSSSEKSHKVWPWVLVGVGALSLGTGVWLVHKDHTDVSMPACTTSPLGRTTCPYSTATMWQGWAFVAVGAELAAAGVVWEILQVRRNHRHVSVALAPGGLVGSF
jgi:hypothetical protein